MTTFCPACGTERRDGATFCAGCGHQYPVVASPPAPRPPVAAPPSMAVPAADAGDTIRASTVRFACGACGATNSAGARFCLACGAEFQDDAPTATVPMTGSATPSRRGPVLAAVGLALVLVAGGAWFLTSRGGEDDRVLDELGTADITTETEPDSATVVASTATASSAPVTTVATTPVTTPVTTVPATTVPPTTAAPTTVATMVEVVTTVAPTTTGVPVAPPPPVITPPPPTVTVPPPVTTVPGDLGITGRAMSRPACDGQFITMVGSTTDPAAWATNVTDLLATYPGASYLRTDQTCPSLRPDVDGNAIYSVYFGPFTTRQAACDARSRGSADAYVKQLARDLDPLHRVDC